MSHWKVLGDRAIWRNIIEGTMVKIWRLNVKVRFQEVGENTFLVSLATRADKYSVEDGRSWLFDNSLFVFERSMMVSPNCKT